MQRLFTSESVSEGHPDKICDQISDAVLDAMLAEDRHSRVACETMVTTGQVIVSGEVTTQAQVDIQKLVRNVIRRIGYTDSEYGFDYRSCGVLLALHTQSPDISQGVSEGEGLHEEQGAGDQGMMFGYACRETPELMPMPIMLSHKLVMALARLRRRGTLPYLRPDSKSQVTVEYEDDRPVRVHTVVISTQHDPSARHSRISRDMIQHVVKKVIPARYLDKDTVYHINPTGRFVVGGPHGDTGLTGRKIIVDTYGGVGRHGAGRFPERIQQSRPERALCRTVRRKERGESRACEPVRGATGLCHRGGRTGVHRRGYVRYGQDQRCGYRGVDPRAFRVTAVWHHPGL